MKIEITNGFVEILDNIPRSIRREYLKNISSSEFLSDVQGTTKEEVEKELSQITDKKRAISMYFSMDEAMTNLFKACTVKIEIDGEIVFDKETDSIDEFVEKDLLIDEDITKVATECQGIINDNEAKKKAQSSSLETQSLELQTKKTAKK